MPHGANEGCLKAPGMLQTARLYYTHTFLLLQKRNDFIMEKNFKYFLTIILECENMYQISIALDYTREECLIFEITVAVDLGS